MFKNSIIGLILDEVVELVVFLGIIHDEYQSINKITDPTVRYHKSGLLALSFTIILHRIRNMSKESSVRHSRFAFNFFNTLHSGWCLSFQSPRCKELQIKQLIGVMRIDHTWQFSEQ